MKRKENGKKKSVRSAVFNSKVNNTIRFFLKLFTICFRIVLHAEISYHRWPNKCIQARKPFIIMKILVRTQSPQYCAFADNSENCTSKKKKKMYRTFMNKSYERSAVLNGNKIFQFLDILLLLLLSCMYSVFFTGSKYANKQQASVQYIFII